MSWPPEVVRTVKQLDAIKRDLNRRFVGRERAIDLLILAVAIQEHLLFIGPPGTAKTRIVTQFCDLVDARAFTYLISRFTEPAELFGPLDLAEFQNGTYQIRTAGMLPEAEICFLDEVFQGSSPILNTLLTIVNERVFHNGSQRQRVPLKTLIGASNLLPDDPWLEAFSDRFLLRLEVAPVADDDIPKLLELGWQMEADDIRKFGSAEALPRELARIQIGALTQLHARLVEVNLSKIVDTLAQIVRELRANGVALSDRRVVKAHKVLAGAALLRNADEATAQDLWPLEHLWSRPDDRADIQAVVHRHMEQAGLQKAAVAPDLTEIRLELNTLDGEANALATDAARHAHLAELSRLRRQVMQFHPKSHDLRRRIEQSIENVMQGLAADHV